MAKPAPYASLERAALRDLATRTIADPSAPAEHVEHARRVLLGTEVSAEALAAQASAVLSLGDMITIRQIIRDAEARASGTVAEVSPFALTRTSPSDDA